MQIHVSNALTRVAGVAASGVGATAGLVWFHLHASSKSAMACITLFLWVSLLISESRAVSQSTLVLLLYVAAFTLPAGFVQFRHVVEGVVGEVQDRCSTIAVRQSKLSAAAAVVAFTTVMGGLRWSLAARFTAAMCAAAGVLYAWYVNADLGSEEAAGV